MMRAIVEAGTLHAERELANKTHPLRLLFSTSSPSSRPARRTAANSSGRGSVSVRQQRVASEIRAVVSTALQQGPYDTSLLHRCGFEIEEVKMSGDLRKAFVLWRAMPGMQQTVEKEIHSHVKRLRTMVFAHLSMPFSPSIEFREKKLNPRAQEIEEFFEQLEEND